MSEFETLWLIRGIGDGLGAIHLSGRGDQRCGRYDLELYGEYTPFVVIGGNFQGSPNLVCQVSHQLQPK